MVRELKEGDRIVDWDGNHGTARNVWDDGFFDFHRDDGIVEKNFLWVEGKEDGMFRFEMVM